MRKIKPYHIHKNTLPCRPQEAKISIHSLLFCPLPSSPTHIVPAPPQLAEFSFGPAQLGLKVQDFALSSSLLGNCVLLGLFHLPRRHRGVAGLPHLGNARQRSPGHSRSGLTDGPCTSLWTAPRSLGAGANYRTSAAHFTCPFPTLHESSPELW